MFTNFPGDMATLKKQYFLRVVPALKHHSEIVSDIPPGLAYDIFILTFFLSYILTF